MKNIFKNPWTYFIVVLILIAGFYGYKSITGKAVQSQYDEFSKYMTEQGAVMYGTEWCPHCKNQKKLFGNSFQYINYTDCDKNQKACSEAGISGYPTWKINNQTYPGGQSIERLAQLSRYNGTI
ncbi:hypothetical protein J4218_02295 [Candidatus Pacearchaeota archaeon]|nr:hypothetical protein [Candidatus Pacearchaeota archaeon]